MLSAAADLRAYSALVGCCQDPYPTAHPLCACSASRKRKTWMSLPCHMCDACNAVRLGPGKASSLGRQL